MIANQKDVDAKPLAHFHLTAILAAAVLFFISTSGWAQTVTVRYVNVNNPTPVSPYTNWATAATVIQDAIDVATIVDAVLVTNGIYQAGGVWAGGTYAPNRIYIGKPISVISVNGPGVTKILGTDATGFQYSGYGRRCAYLTNGAVLAGFTLSAGRVDFHDTEVGDQRGGGVLCTSVSAVVSNCIIAGNFAGRYGGGAYSGTLINCVITDNQAFNLFIGGVGEGGGTYASDVRNCIITTNRANPQGGGACYGSLTNCLVANNTAKFGGGAAAATVVNCTVVQNGASADDGLGGPFGGGGLGGGSALNSIVVQNTGPYGLTNFASAAMSYCCTVPDPGGVGNITNDAAFVNFTAGNYRLATNSPCINTGLNDYLATGVDLDGRPRVVNGLVDMGAYERQHSPWVVIPPVSQSVLGHSNVTFTFWSVGDEPLSYQWQKDGANLTDDARTSGTTTLSLTISNLLAQDAGSYRVFVTNASGTATSAVATLTILGLPIITTQPVSRTVPAATNVSFSVTASGLATLSYQWRFNQSELSGKTNTSLSLTNVQSPHAGDYDVVLTNIYGALTSSVATLIVLPAAPTFTTQAVSRVVSVGQNVSFTVVAKGSEPMTCQWLFNGTNLPGANAFTLALTNVNASFAGTYRAALTNAAGFALSTNATLVVSPVVIWGQTNNPQVLTTAAIPAGATNVIAIAAGGTTDLGLPCMALRADGSIVTWGYFSRDPAPPTNAVDVVAISIGASGATANNLVLRTDGTVVNWTSSTKPPTALVSNSNLVAVAAGGTHQLALRDDGTVIAWGSNTSGQTNVPPSATNVIAIAAGTSHSLALRADGTVVSWGLNTSGQTTALSNLVNVVAIAAGGNQSLALLADGSVVGRIVTNSPTANGTPNHGPPVGNLTGKINLAAGTYHSLALGTNRTINGWGATNYGQLNVPGIASNAVAIAAGGGDSLALVSDPFAPPIPPRIGRPPLGRTLKTGQNVVLNALGVGGLPLRYQWLRDGSPLPGKTNQWLALPGAHPADAGDYQLVALNDFGATTSGVAVVTVSIPPPVLSSPAALTNGFRFSFTSVAGVIYVVEYKDNLFAGVWTELERRFGIGGLEIVTDTSTSGTARFYRVRALYAPSPKLGAAAWSGGAVNFSFATVTGAQYVVEHTEQLAPPQWHELQTISGTGSPVQFTDPNPSGPQGFYRLRVR